MSVYGIGTYREVLASSEPVHVGELEFRVLSLQGLIKAKRAAGRPKDLEALLELEALATIAKSR
jgi:predicted nucleotidyltransferase